MWGRRTGHRPVDTWQIGLKHNQEHVILKIFLKDVLHKKYDFSSLNSL